MVHDLDPSVVKAQTLTKQEQRGTGLAARPSSFTPQLERDKKEKREVRVFERFQDIFKSIQDLDH